MLLTWQVGNGTPISGGRIRRQGAGGGVNRGSRRARRRVRRLPAVGLLIALLFGLALPPSLAQIAPAKPDTPSEAVSVAPWWDLSKAYACGRLLCSDVAFPSVLPPLKGMDPMVLTVQPTPDASLEATRALVEARSRTVRVGVEGIIEQLRRRELPLHRDGMPSDTAPKDVAIADAKDERRTWLRSRFPSFWLITTAKPLHPDTPKVEVGIRNDQTVIFLAPNTKEKLGQVTIVTVTEPDARHAGVPMEELAQRWRQSLRVVFSEALWGMEFNRHYPLARQLIAVAILTLSAGVVLVVLLIYKRLRRLRHRLRSLLRSIEITQRDEANEAFGKAVAAPVDGKGPAASSPAPRPGDRSDEPGISAALKPLKSRSWRWPSLASLERFLDQILGNRERFMADLSFKKLLQPHRIRNIINLLNLVSRVLLLTIIVALALAGVGMFLIFPSTREASLFIALQSLAIPLLWMTLALAQPLLELVIDQVINMWRADAELEDPGRSRYGLRASTYSEVMKMLNGFLFIAVGLYGTILILGVDPSVLAGAGALAIAIGFLARSLLEDMISGLMIIFNDRFALGDVINVGDKGGLVEAINLHITRLRGGDGRLTSIPNRQINVVDNLTQDWARIDFTVRIDACADGRRALEVIGTTAHQLWKEAEWGELIREEPAVLGIDEIGHDGTLIRVWIVTQPLKQWVVGREFRLRVQEDLRREGIPFGVPQRLIRLLDGPDRERDAQR